MAIVTVGIDLAQNVFAEHGVDAAGKAVLIRPNGWARGLRYACVPCPAPVENSPRQQSHIPPRRCGVDRHGLLTAKAVQVMRPAGFRAGTAQPLATERLHADDRADHVAVDVDVADLRGSSECLRARVDAGLDA